eukprot:5978179-Prymnesium_polylepis.1
MREAARRGRHVCGSARHHDSGRAVVCLNEAARHRRPTTQQCARSSRLEAKAKAYLCSSHIPPSLLVA